MSKTVEIDVQDYHALHDKAHRLAAIERQVKEIAARLEHCDDSVSVQEVRPIGRELRAIINAPGAGEEEV